MEVDKEPNITENCKETDFSSIHMHSLINKHVLVNLTQNMSYSGFLHSFDPMTKSAIIFIPLEETFQTILIPGHAIKNITETTTLTTLRPKRKPHIELNELDLKSRKETIIELLKRHRLPAEEKDNIIQINNNVSILPPYTTQDVSAKNPVIAEQITKLLNNLPIT